MGVVFLARDGSKSLSFLPLSKMQLARKVVWLSSEGVALCCVLWVHVCAVWLSFHTLPFFPFLFCRRPRGTCLSR